jgi:hypothetical protein
VHPRPEWGILSRFVIGLGGVMARSTTVLLRGIVTPAVVRYAPRRERPSGFIKGAGTGEDLSANLAAGVDSPVGRPDAGPVA